MPEVYAKYLNLQQGLAAHHEDAQELQVRLASLPHLVVHSSSAAKR